MTSEQDSIFFTVDDLIKVYWMSYDGDLLSEEGWELHPIDDYNQIRWELLGYLSNVC